MVDGINSAKGIQQQQAGQTVKKQESGPQKQNSIFNHAGSTAIEGAISGFAAGSVSVPFFNNGILEGTVEYQVNPEVAGQINGEAALEGGITGTVSVPMYNNGILEGTVEHQVNPEVVGQMTGNIAVDFGGIGEAALEGGIKGAVEGEKEE